MEPRARDKTAFVTRSGLYEFRKMPYLYTDHEALKSLLNMPQQSGRMGLAIQELDVNILRTSVWEA